MIRAFSRSLLNIADLRRRGGGALRALSTDLDNMVIVTNDCAKRIAFLQERNNNKNLYLRLAVEGGGCSGFQYHFNTEDNAINDDDLVFSKGSAKLVVDPVSFEMVKGSTVDYTQELIKRAFEVINNPQSESACGCGSSFAIKNFSANPAVD